MPLKDDLMDSEYYKKDNAPQDETLDTGKSKLQQVGDVLRSIGKIGLGYQAASGSPTAPSMLNMLNQQESQEAQREQQKKSEQQARLDKIQAREDTQDFQRQQRELGLKQIEATKGSANEYKMAESDNKRFEAMNKQLTQASSRGTLGKNQAAIDSIDSAQAIVQQHGKTAKEWDNTSPQMVNEIVAAFSKVVTGGAPTIYSQMEMSPKTLQSKLQEMQQYSMGSPKPAKLGEFIKLFNESLEREKKTNSIKIEKALKGFDAAYKDLKQKDPERYDAIRSAALRGLSPEDFAAQNEQVAPIINTQNQAPLSREQMIQNIRAKLGGK